MSWRRGVLFCQLFLVSTAKLYRLSYIQTGLLKIRPPFSVVFFGANKAINAIIWGNHCNAKLQDRKLTFISSFTKSSMHPSTGGSFFGRWSKLSESDCLKLFRTLSKLKVFIVFSRWSLASLSSLKSVVRTKVRGLERKLYSLCTKEVTHFSNNHFQSPFNLLITAKFGWLFAADRIYFEF